MNRAITLVLILSCAGVGTQDAGSDAGASAPDGGTRDSGTLDSGTLDSGSLDSATPDAGTPDAGTPDAGTPDAGTRDAGTRDAGICVPIDGGLVLPDNANGALDTNRIYVLMTQLNRFRTTNEPRYLIDFVRWFDALMEQRDDRRGVHYRQPVWSTSANMGPCCSTPPGRACEARQPGDLLPDGGIGSRCRRLGMDTTLSSGILSYPLADFARIIRGRPDLAATRLCDGRTLDDVARTALDAAKASVAAHDHEWRADAGTWQAARSTQYIYVDNHDRNLADFPDQPFNINHALGRTVILLAELTQDPRYTAQAFALAQRFKSQLTLQNDGAYEWKYWESDPAIEDITHGWLSIEFARLAYEHQLVFTYADLQAFARTVSLRLILDGGVRYNVNGAVPADAYTRDIGFWASLMPYDHPATRAALLPAYDAGVPITTELGLFADSVIAEYSGTRSRANNDVCTRDAQCDRHTCYAGAVCGDPLGNGSGCTRHVECVSGFCAAGTCAAPPSYSPPSAHADGQACTADQLCQSYRCGDAGVCAQRFAVGAGCARPNDCATGLCLDGGCVAFQ